MHNFIFFDKIIVYLNIYINLIQITVHVKKQLIDIDFKYV